MAKKQKFYYEAKGECPHCSKGIEIKVRRIVLEKSVPAEIEMRLLLDKDKQTKL